MRAARFGALDVAVELGPVRRHGGEGRSEAGTFRLELDHQFLGA